MGTASEAPSGGPEYVHTLRVGWADCDPALIAYTGRIPQFALEAIDVWWTHHVGLGWYELNIDKDIGTPFVHLSVDFRKPVTPRFPLECRVRLTGLGESSVRFEVDGLQDGTLCFEGRFVCVFVAAKAHRRIAAPADIRAVLEPLIHPSATR